MLMSRLHIRGALRDIDELLGGLCVRQHLYVWLVSADRYPLKVACKNWKQANCNHGDFVPQHESAQRGRSYDVGKSNAQVSQTFLHVKNHDLIPKEHHFPPESYL